MVVDEAAFIDEEIWTACLRPALSDRGGKAIFLSTPRGRNWFYHCFERGNDPLNNEWQSWTFPTAANTKIPAEEIAESRRTLPERIFRQEYEAAFLEDGGEVFRNIYGAAIAPHVIAPIPKHRYVMGIDFALYTDFTVCVVIDADEKAMVAMDRFTGTTWALQRERIGNLARKWNVEAILAELNSIGSPNIEALWRDRLPISSFTTTAASKPPLIEGLVSALENVDLMILPDPALLGELGSYVYRNSRAGHTVYEAASGRHDDCVIALALAWKLAATPKLLFGVVDEDSIWIG